MNRLTAAETAECRVPRDDGAFAEVLIDGAVPVLVETACLEQVVPPAMREMSYGLSVRLVASDRVQRSDHLDMLAKERQLQSGL